MQRRRRIGAYGLCRDVGGRVLLVRAERPDGRGPWMLPGGGIEHGEHPVDAVIREFAEETGLTVAVDGLRDVMTDLAPLPDIPAVRHYDRIIFDVRVTGGAMTDAAVWAGVDDLAGMDLMPPTARLLGRPVGGEPVDAAELIAASAVPVPAAAPTAIPTAIPTHVQRFAAYGLATDPAGRVLLTLIADGYPGAGRWHLPGGGTDFGETARDGLLRELVEETDQVGRLDGLIDVSHRHTRGALGPEGVPIDWHGVRVVFRAYVDAPTPPRVVDVGGSTSAAAWFDRREALRRSLTEIAHDAVVRGLT